MCRPSKKAKPHFFQKAFFYRLEKGQRRCPHCEAKEPPLTVQLKVHMTKMPIQLLQSVSKMSFSVKKANLEVKPLARKLGENLSEYKLPNGKVISAENLPEGITKDVMEKLVDQLQDKQTFK